MLTIGNLCKKFGISRSTILYYDKVGLLKPTLRESNNYRMYGADQVNRLEKIVRYRAAGVALKEITKLIDVPNNDVSKILLGRLTEIQSEMKRLKDQETLVIDVLKENTIHSAEPTFTPLKWTEMLLSLGYDDLMTLKWHKSFEDENSSLHRKFLKKLSMTEEEISALLQRLRSLE